MNEGHHNQDYWDRLVNDWLLQALSPTGQRIAAKVPIEQSAGALADITARDNAFLYACGIAPIELDLTARIKE